MDIIVLLNGGNPSRISLYYVDACPWKHCGNFSFWKTSNRI